MRIWIEPVPQTHIAATHQTPDIDQQTLRVKVEMENGQGNDRLRITALEGGSKVAEQEVAAGEEAVLQITNPHAQDQHGARCEWRSAHAAQ